MINSHLNACFVYTLHFIYILIFYPTFLCIAVIRSLLRRRREASVQGEVAVVTGAAQGLGRKIAIELAKRGCQIAVVDILEEEAQGTAKMLSETYNAQAKAYKVDVTSHQQLEQFHSQVTEDFGDVTILVNNAGIILFSNSSPQDVETIQRVVNVNYTSQLWLNQMFLPRMKALNRGHIMAISSLSALFPSPLLQIYSSTKSAVRSYMSALRVELKSKNYKITVTTIMPTFLNTHQPTGHILHSSGLDKVTPPLDGNVVAQKAVEGMLRGVEELTLPGVCNLAYKLQEILPTWIRDKIIELLQPKKDVGNYVKKSS